MVFNSIESLRFLSEGGKGFITRRDVAKMATVHDFTWTEEELQDMIRSFDMDKDGKVGTKLKVFTFIRETLLLNIFNFGQLSCNDRVPCS